MRNMMTNAAIPRSQRSTSQQIEIAVFTKRTRTTVHFGGALEVFVSLPIADQLRHDSTILSESVFAVRGVATRGDMSARFPQTRNFD